MSPLVSERAVTPLVGAVLLVAVCVALAGTAGVALQSASAPDPPPRAHFGVTAHADGRIALVHRGGDRVDVGELRVRVAVDGEALAHQPPVPFFAARGYRAGPTGPFNSRSPDGWTTGERASFRVAATNDPTIPAGSRVEVSLYADGDLVWTGETVARETTPSLRPAPARPRRQSAPVSAAALPVAAASAGGARATVVMATVGS